MRKEGLSHEGVLPGGGREGEPLLSYRSEAPCHLRWKEGASGAVRREPRGTSRLESSGLGLDKGSFQGVRDPGPLRGEEQKGWAVMGPGSAGRGQDLRWGSW